MGFHLRLFHRHGGHHHFRHHAEKDPDVCGRPRPLCDGAARLPLAHRGECPAFHVGARLVLHQKGRYHHPAFHHLCMVHLPLRLGGRAVRHAGGGSDQPFHSGKDRRRHRLDLCAPRLGQLAGDRCLHHRAGCEGEYRRDAGRTGQRRQRDGLSGAGGSLYRHYRVQLFGIQPAVRSLLRGHRCYQA